jgi:hypothetical protein
MLDSRQDAWMEFLGRRGGRERRISPHWGAVGWGFDTHKRRDASAGLKLKEDGGLAGEPVALMRIDSRESFISEPIAPESGTFGLAAMARGEPGLPAAFVWRGKQYTVAGVLKSWKSTGADRSGGSERYVRRHWYRVKTTTGEVMTLYFTRQPPRGRSRSRQRWTLFSMRETSGGR